MNKYIKNINDQRLPINDFRKEYIERNELFCGLDLTFQDLTIGEKSQELLKKQNVSNDGDTIICQRLIGETSEYYHFETNGVMFFTFIEDTENPYNRQYRDVNVDFDHFTAICTMPKFKGFLPHQKDGIKFLCANPRGFNFDDMGLGKTLQSIVAAIACGSEKVLLLTLASTKINHKREVEFFGEKAVIIDDEKSIKGNEDAKFFIVNYDRLKKFIPTSKKDVTLNFLDFGFDTVIVDEIHMAGNPRSIRGEAISLICSTKFVKRVWGLSGTPIENNINFWNICSVLNMGVSDIIPKNKFDKMRAYEEFALRYCNAIKMPSTMKFVTDKIAKLDKILVNIIGTNSRYKTILRVLEANTKIDKGGFYYYNENNEKVYVQQITNGDCGWLLTQTDLIKTITILGKKENGVIIKNSHSLEFGQRIKHTHIRRIAHKTLDGFYEKNIDKILIELTSAEQKLYSIYFEEYLKVKVELGYNIENIGKAVETMKLAQLLACFKVKHSCGFIENQMEIGKKIILFTHFQTEFEMFEKEYGADKRAVFLKSNMDAKKRQAIVDKFQNDESVQLIIGNIDVMGTGINLTKGDIVLFNSPDWSNKKHDQAENRAYRIGRIGNVWVVYMIYENTEEEYIYDVNTLKGDNVEIVIGK